MRVSIFHNITEENGRTAIFSRFGAEGLIQKGDRLQYVGDLEVPENVDPSDAAEFAFWAGNAETDHEWIKLYRSWRVRSLSAGDVVAVEDKDARVTTLGCDHAGWMILNLSDFELIGAVTIDLRIENRYELYDDVETTVSGVVLPTPPDDVTSDEYEDWSDRIREYTGTGREKGDSWYDVEITASSDPGLVGRTFEWGY